MHTQVYGSVEDAVVATDGHAMDVHAQLVADDLGHIVEHSLAVNAAYLYRGIKEELLVHVPFGIEDAVAETCLELGGYGACALVHLYAATIVYVAQNVVSRNGVTAVRIDILRIRVFRYEDGLLLVEVFAHDEEFLAFGLRGGLYGLFLFLAFAQKGHELVQQVARWLLLFALALQFGQVVVAQDDALVANGLKESLMLLDGVQVAELVEDACGHFHAVLFQPGEECGFASFLCVAVGPAEYGLYFGFGLCGADEVYP